jgi:hypothetical protein
MAEQPDPAPGARQRQHTVQRAAALGSLQSLGAQHMQVQRPLIAEHDAD